MLGIRHYFSLQASYCVTTVIEVCCTFQSSRLGLKDRFPNCQKGCLADSAPSQPSVKTASAVKNCLPSPITSQSQPASNTYLYVGIKGCLPHPNLEVIWWLVPIPDVLMGLVLLGLLPTFREAAILTCRCWSWEDSWVKLSMLTSMSGAFPDELPAGDRYWRVGNSTRSYFKFPLYR